jgi:hypothetical protein
MNRIFSSLDIPSIPQIIALIKIQAVTEESKLAEAARDAQPLCGLRVAFDRTQLKFPLEPFR